MPIELEDRGKALEEKFFKDLEAKQLEVLREKKEKSELKEQLRKASGMTDDAVLERLVDLGVNAQTVSAMSLVPLVQVAWADGSIDEREREAILHGAQGKGIEPGSASHALLSKWLEQQPDDRLMDAWIGYIRALDEHLTPEQHKLLKRQVIDRARAVAEAAGGFLGIGRISKEEEQVLAKLEAAFDR